MIIRLNFPFFLFLFFSLNSHSQFNDGVKLSGQWQFRQAGDPNWLPASVPGTVYSDLLANKIIEDPYYGDHERKVQWVDTCSWEYQLYFDAVDPAISENHCELIFEGLDTYAKVFLNDSLILNANNMFCTWNVDCKKILKSGRNRLLVRFESAIKKGRALANQLPYMLPGEERAFTRKAAFQYGWDWAPRFTGCGIWRPVKLKAWSDFTINNIRISNDELNDSAAIVSAHIALAADKPDSLLIQLYVEGTGRDTFIFRQKIKAGKDSFPLQFKISNPRIWWSNGSGDPDLYRISLHLSNAANHEEQFSCNFGLRTLQLVENMDSTGKSFYFSLNGEPTFMKGANWVPADHFLPEVKREKYRLLLMQAQAANMNMLRVWGGGIYEDDTFYELCDSLGILVWQDFMFANTVYPGDSLFINSVKSEVMQNSIRIRNHPCLAIWCGNNEIDEGWKNWGWQKQYHYSMEDSIKLWKDYSNLFDHTIPGIISGTDPGRAYTPSSPRIGWGHDESYTKGDAHYWGVWWGRLPFDMYNRKVGRFMSEYGFQGMPSYKTVSSFTSAEERNLQSAAVKNHQKHPTGFETIDHYMDAWYRKPKSFENYIYVSQLLQAEGIKIAIEAHRRAAPRCMGTLYWQLNDCWPVTSWSSLDYSGRWKALHYFVRESYKPFLVSAQMENGKLDVSVSSDSYQSRNLTLELKLTDFNGKIKWERKIPVAVKKNSGEVVLSLDSATLLKNLKLSQLVLQMKLVDKTETLARNSFYFLYPKNLELPDRAMKWILEKGDGDQFRLIVSSSNLAKNVFLELGPEDVHFSENYFDLFPGEEKIILFRSRLSLIEVDEKLYVSTLKDSY